MTRFAARGWMLDGLLVAAWLTSVGFVALNVRGGWWGGLANPTSTLAAGLDAKEQWFVLSYQGRQVGFSRMAIAPDERNGIPGVSVSDTGRLAFTLLGAPQEMTVNSDAFIDANWRLQAFTASVTSPTAVMRWTGRRQGGMLLISVRTATSTVTKELRDPNGSAFVNGLSSWTAFHRLRAGQSGRTWVINPLSLSPEVVYFSVRRREVIDGRPILVVESDMAGLTTTTRVTPSGDVVQETSPLGWELRQSSMQEAMQTMRARPEAADFLAATAVPVNRPLAHPETLESLTLLLEGADASQVMKVQRPSQTVLPEERLRDYQAAAPSGPWCLIRLSRPSRVPAPKTIPEEIRRYLKPSTFVQSDDARILAKARELIGARTDPWEQATALTQGVFSLVAQRLTIGMSSALDVLATPSGDCQEHTVLYTALARSLGLPTRMAAGLVYQQGRFYYHAWPEVWLGGWIPTDPTLGQLVADPTHVGLVEAEHENLIALGPFIGKMRIQILEAKE